MSQPFARELLAVSPAQFLHILPLMGKLMITARAHGATHERIGTVERVEASDGHVALLGAEHDSRFDLSAIHSLVADRTGRMGEMELPRVDILDEGGEAIASVVGFGGLAPFDAALATLPTGTELAPKEPAPPAERGEVADNDPGRTPFDLAMAKGLPISVEFRRPGFHQRWQGAVETVKPAMGFINLMRPDFHLHLKAGAVARWEASEGPMGSEWTALDAAGNPLGLHVSGPAAAFSAAG